MLLWDYEMKPELPLIEAMDAVQRLSTAVEALAWSYSTMRPPVEDEATRSLIERGLVACRAALAAGSGEVEREDGFLEEVDEVYEETEEEGTAHLLSAVTDCFDSADGGLTADGLYTILSYCYEGIVDREEIDEVTPEAERSNARCVEAIRFQKDLLRRA
ncbi:hypothetical protein [Streptomyces sp. NPDC002133]|uniref:hypothetical protein n=1 Tax=Streptomyces sp. NPDC002133 TaxID=3154409 RepID=UPI00331DB7DB